MNILEKLLTLNAEIINTPMEDLTPQALNHRASYDDLLRKRLQPTIEAYNEGLLSAMELACMVVHEAHQEAPRSMLYDPPAGWMYGFPMAWPLGMEISEENLRKQLLKDGYPARNLDSALRHTRFIG